MTPNSPESDEHIQDVIREIRSSLRQSRQRIEGLENRLPPTSRDGDNAARRFSPWTTTALSFMSGLVLATIFGSLSFWRDFTLVQERQRIEILQLEDVYKRLGVQEQRNTDESYRLRVLEQRVDLFEKAFNQYAIEFYGRGGKKRALPPPPSQP